MQGGKAEDLLAKETARGTNTRLLLLCRNGNDVSRCLSRGEEENSNPHIGEVKARSRRIVDSIRVHGGGEGALLPVSLRANRQRPQLIQTSAARHQG